MLNRPKQTDCRNEPAYPDHECVVFALMAPHKRIMRVEHLGLAEAVLQDNPDMDATDAAHPAWWRGSDHAHQVLCKEVNEYLDGKELGTGVCCEPWQSTRKRLVQLRKELRTLWIHLLS